MKGIAIAKLNLAELLFSINKYNEGYSYLPEALAISLSLQSKDLLVEIHEYLAKYYKKMRNYKESLHHLKLFESYKDSIYLKLQEDIILEEKVKLETENKRKEIIAYKKDH